MINEIESAEADRLEAEADALHERAEALEDELEETRLRARKLDELAREMRHGPVLPASVLGARHLFSVGLLRRGIDAGRVRGFRENRRLFAFERDVARWVSEGCPTNREAYADGEEING